MNDGTYRNDLVLSKREREKERERDRQTERQAQKETALLEKPVSLTAVNKSPGKIQILSF
jgi:hypothetical protein